MERRKPKDACGVYLLQDRKQGKREEVKGNRSVVPHVAEHADGSLPNDKFCMATDRYYYLWALLSDSTVLNVGSALVCRSSMLVKMDLPFFEGTNFHVLIFIPAEAVSFIWILCTKRKHLGEKSFGLGHHHIPSWKLIRFFHWKPRVILLDSFLFFDGNGNTDVRMSSSLSLSLVLGYEFSGIAEDVHVNGLVKVNDNVPPRILEGYLWYMAENPDGLAWPFNLTPWTDRVLVPFDSNRGCPGLHGVVERPRSSPKLVALGRGINFADITPTNTTITSTYFSYTHSRSPTQSMNFHPVDLSGGSL
ncbi:hypothetical protein KQX54_019290 [Cotesia glomerata]|uniref:Uncharacterized protein n=1 Tax=Cotesia glomerata TaxID=32391 RepID=A0AAV7HLF9_COTGL|nr:hypothetical protein KQX54_019290 [Cotesia glomerata]